MSTNVKTLATIRSLSDGVVVVAIVSAMTSVMSMAASSTVGAAGVHAMGSFVPYTGGGKKQPAKRLPSGPYEELESLEDRIRKLSYKLGIQGEAVRGTREHKIKLMHEYGLTVLPSVVEMRKYPKLRATDYYLRKGEKELERMETNMMFMRRRRKELQEKLGMRAEEEERRRVYPAMKKFRPAERRY